MPYVTHITTTQLRGIPPLEITLEPGDGRAFRHLVLTGANGSGKTSILGAIATQIFADLSFGRAMSDRAIRQYAQQSVALNDEALSAAADDDELLDLRPARLVQELVYGHVTLTWTPPITEHDQRARQRVVFSYMPARRGIDIRAVSAISAEHKLGRKSAFDAEAPRFLQFLVNRKAQQSFARDDGDLATAGYLDAWFSNLDRSLARLFGEDPLHLEFDRKTLNFFLVTGGHRYSLLELAHGHAAALGILAEVLMRVELTPGDEGERDSGVILIDEPEMHLHLELQERILPALVEMFPNIQLIVATHSPAVVSSIDDAIVFDLEDREPRRSEDLRGRPYGWIMKRHFGLEEDFDLATTEQLRQLDQLRRLESRTPEQQSHLEQLAEQLSGTSHALALEVWNRVLSSRLEGRQAGSGGGK